MSNETEYQQISGSNQNQVNDHSFMKYRLSSDEILMRVEIFLKGTKAVLLRDNEGNYIEQEQQTSKPLANSTGINQLMNKLYVIVNPQTVQGNIDTNQYYSLVAEWRGDLKDDLIMNCGDWDIEDIKLDYICNYIMSLIEPFFTRLINNKERDSYKETMVSRETISPDFMKKKGMMKGILQ